MCSYNHAAPNTLGYLLYVEASMAATLQSRGRGFCDETDVEGSRVDTLYATGAWGHPSLASRGRGVNVEGSRGNVELLASRVEGRGSTLSLPGDREVWPKMENRSRLPGEPSLDHPGVPTGRLGHRAGLKTVGGIPGRLFCGLPALPRKCSDPGVGASSTDKCRSPQTAPRLRRPYG